MSGDPDLPPCPRTDAVLAVHLDGDVGGRNPVGGDPDDAVGESGFDFVCVDALQQHLLDCTSCQRQLRRARRLDAALAIDAGRATADAAAMAALEARWLAAVAATAAPAAAHRPAAPGRPAAWFAPAVAVAAAGLLAWLGLATATPRADRRDAPAPAADPAPPRPAPAIAIADPSAILIAADAARRPPERPRVAVPTPAALGALCAADDVAPAGRLAAARTLLATIRTPGPDSDIATDALILALASAADRSDDSHSLLVGAHGLARAEPRFVAGVQRRLGRLEAADAVADLPTLAAFTVAARLGTRPLDAAVLRAVRAHPELAEPLAATVRSGLRRHGTATLLLDVWQDLGSRGALGGDEFAGQVWFAGQADSTFGDLVRELATSASAPRRVHCLLALGFGPADEVLPVLLARLHAASHLEAHAAAFALSRLPTRALQSLVDRAGRADDAGLLRAALARAGAPGTEPWLAALSLDHADRTRLHTCPFRDFPFVATWFRDRPIAGSG